MGLTVPRDEHPDDHQPAETLGDRVKAEIDRLLRERERLARELGTVNSTIERFERALRPGE